MLLVIYFTPVAFLHNIMLSLSFSFIIYTSAAVLRVSGQLFYKCYGLYSPMKPFVSFIFQVKSGGMT